MLDSDSGSRCSGLDLRKATKGTVRDMAGTAEEAPPKELPFVAQRLDLLFRTASEKAGRKIGAGAVADGINAAAGEKVIEQSYIWQVRTGRKDNPSYKVLAQLAGYFGVHPAFFFPDDENAIGPDLQVALRDERIRNLVLLTAGLSGPSIEAVTMIAKNSRSLEGLPEPSA
jgi:transcriptional regulator with XRE-family HTH domain